MPIICLLVTTAGLLAAAFNVVSLTTVKWVHYGTDSFGLWRSCSKDGCAVYIQVPAYIWKTRIFLIFSVVNVLTAVVTRALSVFRKAENRRISAGLLLTGALDLLSGLVVFTAAVRIENAQDGSFGCSYMLGWAAFSMAFLAGFGVAYTQ